MTKLTEQIRKKSTNLIEINLKINKQKDHRQMIKCEGKLHRSECSMQTSLHAKQGSNMGIA